MAQDDVPPMPAALMPGPDDLTDGEVDAYIASYSDDGHDAPILIAQGIELETDDAPAARWRIRSYDAAEWAMRQLAAVALHEQDVDTQARAWAAQIAEWRARMLQPLAARRAFFEAHLTRYAIEFREASNDKTKTIVLPSGKVPTTKRSAKVVIADEALLLGWVKANLEPDQVAAAVKVTEKVLVSELRDHVAIVDVCTIALLSCGHESKNNDGWPEVGTAVECPTCEIDGGQPTDGVLVARWLGVRKEVHDDAGRVVPGASVDAEEVTARVEPNV